MCHTFSRVFGVFVALTLFIRVCIAAEGAPGVRQQAQLRQIASGCLPATSWAELNIGNVRARINTGGDMWWDLQGDFLYEVPKGSGKMFTGNNAIWIGGLDPNGQLRLAAQKYRQAGNDFWTGPLSIDGNASVDPVQCSVWDRMFVITRDQVAVFLSHLDPETGVFVPTDDYLLPPEVIREWPWQGDLDALQTPYLAPFYDRNKNGVYEWELGDYPYYMMDPFYNGYLEGVRTLETEAGVISGGMMQDQILKGDQTIWWVFNDKGNVHSESGGEPIGLEIRAQAFAFEGIDDVENATFYSYEIINRSVMRLEETWFGLMVNGGLGYSWDDYAGIDVGRGLGYLYNGFEVDGSGQSYAYGASPPAIGFNFYLGPYADPDGIDNLKYENVMVIDPNGDTTYTMKLHCDESINGTNFQDGIVDNERLGTQRFIYLMKGAMYTGHPQIAPEFYNYLKGLWRDGSKLVYGGNGHISSGGYGPDCSFMFPGESDPCDWGTGGVPPNGPRNWTEKTVFNQPYWRCFLMSTGPFTLESGGVNYITFGVPWARPSQGGVQASMEWLRQVDSRIRNMFNGSFILTELRGPDAPDLIVREMDRELILYLVNRKMNQNFHEDYSVWDPGIVFLESLPSHERGDSLYRFEGYQIYQLFDEKVTLADVQSGDAGKARLVAQCDKENTIARIVNYEYDKNLRLKVPRIKVDGNNTGLFHSIRITEDLFANGDKQLVNHKTYYYMAVSYAHNQYLPYSTDPSIPELMRGQKKPYLAGIRGQNGMPITPVSAIPHISTPMNGGTQVNSSYGDGPSVTRIEGNGNGGMVLEFTRETISKIMSGPPHKAEHPVYTNGSGPILVKVTDPLQVQPGKFTIMFSPSLPLDSTQWTLYYEHQGQFDTLTSDQSIKVANEQLLLNYGLSITIAQVPPPGSAEIFPDNGLLYSSITYTDTSKCWLTGIKDRDIPGAWNWIRSGTLEDLEFPENNDYIDLDPYESYEKVVDGTWAPYRLASSYQNGPQWNQFSTLNRLENLHSVDVVFTSDKSLWTRCAVIETCDDADLAEGGKRKMQMRSAPSKDRNGSTGTAEATAGGTQPIGMSYFPGYAINLETGERLNMAFGEDSWLAGENGRDMLWNPTGNYQTPLGEIRFGGKHFIYVFGHNTNDPGGVPPYDEGYMINNAFTSGNNALIRKVYADALWVTIPIIANGFKLNKPDDIPTDAMVRIRVQRPYRRYLAATTGAHPVVNNDYPMYSFSTNDLAPSAQQPLIAKDALRMIRAVPNPYYAFSAYEKDPLDHRVKIINLPEKCTVSIYNVNGSLVKTFRKESPDTWIEWDLKNQQEQLVSGGVYLIHVKVPDVGETVVKWFGTMRADPVQ